MTFCCGLRLQTAANNACKAKSVVIRDCNDHPTTRLESKRPVWPPYDAVFKGSRSSTRLIL